RLGFASSRAQARQLVGHGHFAVNGVPTNIPSFQLKPGDRVEVRDSRRPREPFKLAKETLRSHQPPEWLSLDAAKLSGAVAELPGATRCRPTSTGRSLARTTWGKPATLSNSRNRKTSPFGKAGRTASTMPAPS